MRENKSRRQVLEQALSELQAEGRTPTVRALRERAGGGSFSTIVSVLQRHSGQAASVYSPANKTSAPATALPFPKAVFDADPPSTATAPAEWTAVTRLLQQLQERLDALHHEVHKLRESHAAELQLAYERFESVQKYSLMEVHKAREETRAAQRALQDARAGVRTREDVLVQQAAHLRDQVAFLKGQVAALGGQPNASR